MSVCKPIWGRLEFLTEVYRPLVEMGTDIFFLSGVYLLLFLFIQFIFVTVFYENQVSAYSVNTADCIRFI